MYNVHMWLCLPDCCLRLCYCAPTDLIALYACMMRTLPASSCVYVVIDVVNCFRRRKQGVGILGGRFRLKSCTSQEDGTRSITHANTNIQQMKVFGTMYRWKVDSLHKKGTGIKSYPPTTTTTPQTSLIRIPFFFLFLSVFFSLPSCRYENHLWGKFKYDIKYKQRGRYRSRISSVRKRRCNGNEIEKDTGEERLIRISGRKIQTTLKNIDEENAMAEAGDLRSTQRDIEIYRTEEHILHFDPVFTCFLVRECDVISVYIIIGQILKGCFTTIFPSSSRRPRCCWKKTGWGVHRTLDKPIYS